jgi:membrane fusion protein (multidrug efflux system)
VVTEALTGPQWIVTDGLIDGDRMIVSGTQNARPGATVAAVPYAAQGETAQAASAAAPAGGPAR